MNAITLSATVSEDHKLIIELPEDVPPGEVEVVIRPVTPPQETAEQSNDEYPPYNAAREAARAKMLAAGKLVTWIKAPEGTVPLTPEERMRIGTLPPGARPSEELIDEDRGEY